MSADKQRLLADLEFLCDPALDGRAPGSIGHRKVQDFLRSRLTALGVSPLFAGSYDQPIITGRQEVGCNLCGLIPGKGDGIILLGAHYDHFAGIQGADDNAAAVAILLELAGRLGQWHGQTNLAICLFDLEEPPHFHQPTMGSIYFVKHCPIRLDRLRCAIIMDLCGHDVPLPGAEDAVFVMGAEYSATLFDAVQRADHNPLPLLMVRNALIGDMSDHHAFRMAGAAFLFLSCGWWKHYHQPTDTLDRLNTDKILRIADSIAGLLEHLDCENVSKSPPRYFLQTEAMSFKRLTGIDIPADDAIIRAAAAKLIEALM